MNKVIFNADDFGISRGVNAAVLETHRRGILNAASLMVNQKYALEAVNAAQSIPTLELGLHVNLTNEKPAADFQKIPLLVGADGQFKNGFVKLLLLSFLHPYALRQQVEIEVEAQVLKARQMGVKLSHLDSHRHVHMIPVLFDAFENVRRKYQIPRIRIINECALLTLRTNKSWRFLLDGGLLKYLLLRFFAFLNGARSKTYFYTMLYTCKLSREHFEKVLIPQGFDSVEIMVHPSITKIDRPQSMELFDPHVVSPWRDREFAMLLNKTLIKNFVFDTPYPFIWRVYQKIEKLWFRSPQKIRYLLVGGFNTAFAFGVYAFLLKILCLPYLLALIVQYFITVNVSILSMRYYVFQSHGNFGAEYTKAWGVYLSMFCFNSVFLSFLVEVFRLNELWAQGVYLTVSTVLTYLLHKYFSFHQKN